MTQEHRLRRKDLKGPDEFQNATHRVLGFLKEHEREAMVGVVALVAVIAIVLAVQGYRSWRDAQAAAAFREAFQAYVADDEERATPGFESVIEGWPGSRWAQLSSIYRGGLAGGDGDRTAAKAAFERVLEETNEPVLRQIAEYNLGILERNSGEDAAVEHLRRAAAIDGPLQAAAIVAIAAGPESDAGTLDRERVAELEGVLPPELREFVAEKMSRSD